MPGVRIREFTREHLLFMLYKMAQQRDEYRAVTERVLRNSNPIVKFPGETS